MPAPHSSHKKKTVVFPDPADPQSGKQCILTLEASAKVLECTVDLLSHALASRLPPQADGTPVAAAGLVRVVDFPEDAELGRRVLSRLAQEPAAAIGDSGSAGGMRVKDLVAALAADDNEARRLGQNINRLAIAGILVRPRKNWVALPAVQTLAGTGAEEPSGPDQVPVSAFAGRAEIRRLCETLFATPKTLADVRKHLGVSRQRAHDRLRTWMTAGLIERVNDDDGNSFLYVLTGRRGDVGSMRRRASSHAHRLLSRMPEQGCVAALDLVLPGEVEAEFAAPVRSQMIVDDLVDVLWRSDRTGYVLTLTERGRALRAQLEPTGVSVLPAQPLADLLGWQNAVMFKVLAEAGVPMTVPDIKRAMLAHQLAVGGPTEFTISPSVRVLRLATSQHAPIVVINSGRGGRNRIALSEHGHRLVRLMADEEATAAAVPSESSATAAA